MEPGSDAGRRGADRAEPFTIGDWLVTPAEGRITGPDQVSRHISPKGMDVLVCLAGHAGAVVSKEQLLAEVWGTHYVSEGVLANAVRELRGALGDEARRPRFIETISKRGYRLVAAGDPGGDVGAGSSRPSVCVLPFVNMSGEPEQEYFSDGISEDVITDLSKVSALKVTARNTSFQFKGQNVDIPQLARQLGVEYFLEGSVRKAGGRVRISAQLIDGTAGHHVWAERFDRDLQDVFALQDEVSQAIVNALKVRLLPEERRAIERRGTESVDAYDLYLMARRFHLNGALATADGGKAVVRLCTAATKLDAGYAEAWSLLALAQSVPTSSQATEQGLAAADRALALDASSAIAHVAKGRIFYNNARYATAEKEYAAALRIDPESFDANMNLGLAYMTRRDYEQAVRFLEKAASLSPSNPNPMVSLLYVYRGVGDYAAERRVAEKLLARAEETLRQQPDDTNAMCFAATSLAALGTEPRARQMIRCGMLIDPDSAFTRVHYARALGVLDDPDHACEMIERYLKPTTSRVLLDWLKVIAGDTALANHAHFKGLLARAEAAAPAAPDA